MDITNAKAYNKAERRTCGKQPVNQKNLRFLPPQASPRGQGGSQKSPGLAEAGARPADPAQKGSKQKKDGDKYTFAIDSQISGADTSVGIRSRPLKPWIDENADTIPGASVRLEDDPEFNKGWDQFGMNEALFGVKPSVGIEEKYTISIARSAPDFKERQAAATRIAQEIESERTNNIVLMEDRVMDHTVEIDENAMYSAVVSNPSQPALIAASRTKVTGRRRSYQRLKESVNPPIRSKTSSAPASNENSVKQDSSASHHLLRKNTRSEHVQKKEQQRPDVAGAIQKRHKGRQNSNEKGRDSTDKTKEEPRNHKNFRNVKISKSQIPQPINGPTPADPPKASPEKEKKAPAPLEEPDGVDTKVAAKSLHSPRPHPIETLKRGSSPQSSSIKEDSIPAIQTSEHSDSESLEYSTPGLNVYAEEFTPSTGYSLYTSKGPSTEDVQTPCYTSADSSRYCITQPDYRYGQVYSASDTTMYQLRPECYPSQPYHSADDVSKYRAQQQYYPYPVAFCPYNFIPVTRMVSATVDSRMRTFPFTQRVETQEDSGTTLPESHLNAH